MMWQGCCFITAQRSFQLHSCSNMHAGYAVKEGKKHAGPQPQKWARVAAQAKGPFQKVQGCPCCSAAIMRGWTLTATSNAKTCVQPAAVYRTLGATPGTPGHQSCFRTLQSSYTGKGSKTGFCEWQRWFLGSGAMFAYTYPHTSRGSNVKLAIHIGSAAKLLRMCSKATVLSIVSHFVLAWPQSY